MAMMELVMEVMETGEMPPGMPPDVMEELLADAALGGDTAAGDDDAGQGGMGLGRALRRL